MRSGSDLVPVFSFGENDVSPAALIPLPRRADMLSTQIFEQLANERGTKIYALQKKFQAVFGFTLRSFARFRIRYWTDATLLSSLLWARSLQLCVDLILRNFALLISDP